MASPLARTATIPIYEVLLGDSRFRVLHLLPAEKPTDSIVCRLTVEDLVNKDTQYEAISYTWGVREPQFTITCNGHEQMVGPNLHSLLVSLRLATKPRALWADAICIGQTNDEEKGRQVRLMQQIYQNAARVVVWLGSEDDNLAPAAYNAACRMAGAWIQSLGCEMPDTGYRIGCQEYHLSAEETKDVGPDEKQGWAALECLFSKEYWERLWVVQELTSSTVAVIRWGQAEIPWTWIGIAASLIRHNYDKSTNMTQPKLGHVFNACLMFLLTDEDWASTEFLDLMGLLLRFKVTHQHDRAYAILGLPGLHTGSSTTMPFVQPDYGLSLHELYLHLAERIIDTHENPLDILSAVKHHRDSPGKKPRSFV